MAELTQDTALTDRSVAQELARLDRLARLLDTRYRLFGIRFGWDTILGLVPGVGDTLTALPSLWLILQARRLGAPKGLVAGMVARTGVDYVLGSVPLVGDLFDLGFKANRRNVDALRRHLTERPLLPDPASPDR